MDNFGIMEDVFISNIKINKVRHLENLEIPLSGEERKHLILTGKNGSGKTSVLDELANQFRKVDVKHYANQFNLKLRFSKDRDTVIKGENVEERLDKLQQFRKDQMKGFDIECEMNNNEDFIHNYEDGNFIINLFDSKRHSKFRQPEGAKKIELKNKYQISEKANLEFIQYMVNLRFSYLEATVSSDNQTVKNIDKWLNVFTNRLKELFDDPDLALIFDSENYNWFIQSEGKKFDFNSLSDGFSSVLNIISELMMRMNKQRFQAYDMQGIVLIDEIETHLHIDLQKKILPFLTSFFPKIQFIVTTHSPFVLTSIKDAVIYDLEHQEAIEDLSGYSVEAIIEGYFGSDKYSEALKAKVDEYEQLAKKDELSYSEEERYQSLKKYFDDLSDVFAEELKLKIQQIKLLNPVK